MKRTPVRFYRVTNLPTQSGHQALAICSEPATCTWHRTGCLQLDTDVCLGLFADFVVVAAVVKLKFLIGINLRFLKV